MNCKRFKKFKRDEKEEDAVLTAIKQNNLIEVQNIINKVGFDFSKIWLGGCILLCRAIYYNQREIVSWLLAKDCKINLDSSDKNSDTPLHLATSYNNRCLVETLLKKGASITAKNSDGETALHISCRKGNSAITRLLLSDDTIVNVLDNSSSSPLHIAVETGCSKIIELLLKHKVDINARTRRPGYEGFTALHIAIIERQNKIVNILLKNGADIQAVVGIPKIDEISDDDFYEYFQYQNYTPLHLAVETKSREMIQLLLNYNADVNAVMEHNGFTPLHVAVQNNDDPNVLLLHENGAKFDMKTKDGKSFLHVALEYNYWYFVQALLSKGADINGQTNNGETLLFMAVEKGDEEWVELLLEYNPNVNLANHQKKTPLHIAAEFSEAIVKILLDSGANVDEIDANDDTPLSIAVKHCNATVVQEILHYKPSIHDISNKSALIYATKNVDPSYLEILHLLIDYGFQMADKSIINVDLLNYLISKSQFKILEHVLGYGSDAVVKLKNQKKSSFVQKAVETGDSEMIKLLIAHGFNLNVLDSFGKSAIDYAIELNKVNLLELLLKNGAEINNSPFALIYSTKHENITLFEQLLDYTDNVSLSDEFGTTPLHLATWNTDYEFVQLLLDKGACIDTTDSGFEQMTIDGGSDSYTQDIKRQMFTSPLHIAVNKKDKDICKMFLECHANVNSKDGYGRTPLHIAAAMKSSHQKLIIKTLFNYGADVNALDDFKRLPIYYLYNQSCVCSIAFQNHYNLYSECECDLYEENQVNDVISTFVQHIVLLKSMNKDICTENYDIIQSNDFSRKLLTACLNEVLKMKEKKLYDRISFYDLLNKRGNSLAACARNESLVQAFERTNCEKEFPLYCDMIREQFDRAQKRNDLLEAAILSFSNLTDCALPYAVIEYIFDFLLHNDLRSVTDT